MVGKLGAFQRLLDGTNVKVVCTLPGTSQYTKGAGGSSCGLACLNAIRVVYGLEGTGVQLLEQMHRPETIRSCLAICASWNNNVHLDTDAISRLPLFEASIKLQWTNYGQPEEAAFARMLQRLAMEVRTDACIAVVLTRPPEMITVFCIPTATANQRVLSNDRQACVYAVFDSHPRPIAHPDGAAFTFFRDAASAATYLADLLRVDASLYSSGALQWQAQLLAQFSARCFAPKRSTGRLDLVKHAYDVNASLMDLRLRISDMDGEMRKALEENDRLKKQIDRERERNKALAEEARSIRLYATEKDARPQSVLPSLGKAPCPFWGIPRGSRQGSVMVRPLYGLPFPPVLNNSTTNAENRSERRRPSDCSSLAVSTPPTPNLPLSQPTASDTRSKVARAILNSQAQHEDLNLDDDDSDSDSDLAARLQAEEQRALSEAQRLQAQFDEENAKLCAERDALEETVAQKGFDCAVCMETWAEDGVARVDECGHALCRPCMLQYIQSALRDRIFPIVCPVCKAENRGKGEYTAIAPNVVESIGLNEAEVAVWDELQISGFSLKIECRKCKNVVAVDREDYNSSPWIKCPVPACHYVSCKECNQEIPPGPIDHSCDGTKELDRLMKQSGWKYCPGCNTPCEKISGCPHLACPSPGCNTHFCYKCGGLIVNSSTAAIIATHKAQHAAKCGW